MGLRRSRRRRGKAGILGVYTYGWRLGSQNLGYTSTEDGCYIEDLGIESMKLDCREILWTQNVSFRFAFGGL